MPPAAMFVCLATLLLGLFTFPAATLAGLTEELQQAEARMREMKTLNDRAHAAYLQNQTELRRKEAERRQVAAEINQPSPEEKYWRTLSENQNVVFVHPNDLPNSFDKNWGWKIGPYRDEMHSDFHPVTRQAWKESLKEKEKQGKYSKPNMEYTAEQTRRIKSHIRNVIIPQVKQQQAQDILKRTGQLDAEILRLKQAGSKLKADHTRLHQEYLQLKKRRQALKTALKQGSQPRSPQLTQPTPRTPAAPHTSGDRGPSAAQPQAVSPPGSAKGTRPDLDLGRYSTQPPKSR